jgi:hypothetical protein
MGVVVFLLGELLFRSIQLAPTIEHAVVLLACIAAGAAAYLALARALHVQEVATLWRLLSGR